MTQERPHSHQSDYLPFLPPDYQPLRENNEGQRIYGVLTLNPDLTLRVFYSRGKPAYGGYANVGIYGSPDYCGNATRLHRKHREQYDKMPHLVFFDSAETAVASGFRPCRRCILRSKKGEEARVIFEWKKYQQACRKLGVPQKIPMPRKP